MNTQIQSQLDRVESALNNLTDSITSYNPSVSSALDLLTADDELAKGVEQLATHQTNHARILRLRETNTALNAQIASTLTLLADTRKDLLSTPSTVFPETQRDVSYIELLDYAKRISRFTVPPTFRQPPIPQSTISEAVTNGVSNAIVKGGVEGEEKTGEGKVNGIGVSSLEQSEIQWLDPLAQIPFVPWPSEEVIKRGALAQIQGMLEQGIDPAGLSGEIAEEGFREMEAKEEDVEVKREDGAPEVQTEGRMVERREEKSKPMVFGGLDLYDPDEEG